MNRAEAKASGSKTYKGSPCPYGHDGTRYTQRGTCVDCAKANSRDKQAAGYFAARYAAKRDEILAKQRACPSPSRVVRAQQWAKRNPEKRKAISRQYKAKRRSLVEGGISGGVLAAWTLAQPKLCFYCGADCGHSFHVDHFLPLVRGGAHVLTNLRIACASCNLRKNARDPVEWLERSA